MYTIMPTGRESSGNQRIAALPLTEARTRSAEYGTRLASADRNVFRTLLRHAELAKPLDDLVGMLLDRGRLPSRLRELVIMRIGWLTRSTYEWSRHWHVAQSVGLSPLDVADVRDWRTSDRYTAPERAAFQATDEAWSTDRITEETWNRCQVALDDVQLLELVAVIGNWRMMALLLNSVQIALEDADTAWPPDGREPKLEIPAQAPNS